MIWRRLCVLGSVLVLLGLAPCNTAMAQQVFLVSQSDTNRQAHEIDDGWGEGTAFATIQAAIDAAQLDPAEPHVILVEEGTYPETHTLGRSPNAQVVQGVLIDAGSDIVLRGVLPRGFSEAEPRRPEVTITIDGSEGGTVVKIDGKGSGVTLDTLDITGGDIGVEIIGQGENEIAAPTIMNCVISNNTDGIDCLAHTAPRIINCMVVDNTDAGVVCHADSQPSFMNDTIAGNATGIDDLTDLNLVITNTIAWGNTPIDIEMIGLTDELTVSFSDIGDPDFSGTNGNINDDPDFIDTASADYGIPQNSPCVDLGTDAGAPLVDFEGHPRDYDVGDQGNEDPPGPVVDIGADEHIPAAAVTPPIAYAIPDPTSFQPPGGLLFFVFSSGGTPIGSVSGRSSTGSTISTTRVTGSGGAGYVIAVNATPIDELTGDGTADIEVDSSPAGTFLIDTTPPTVGPGSPNPFHILDGGEGSWTNHNDFIDVADLNIPGYWVSLGLPALNVPTDADVPNDGQNFFFNTGASRVDGTIVDVANLFLEIDFVVEADDPGAVPSGFDEFWALSGAPVIRPQTHADQYIEPIPGGGGPSTTWTLQFRPQVEGAYSIDIVAEDRAGNVSDPLPVTVYWDKTPPETRITSKPRAEEPSTRASFTWRLAGSRAPRYSTALQLWDPALGVWILPLAIGFTPFYPSESTTYSNLEPPGDTYRFTVLGIDDAGNLEASITPYNQWVWTVSSPVPDTVIISGPPRVTTERRATFTFKEVPEDPEVQFQYMLVPIGQEEWAPAPGNSLTRGLRPVGPPGREMQYVFSVRAWKDYGEGPVYDPTPATYMWTVVPQAYPGDPGVPRPLPEFPEQPLPPGALETYGVGSYVDAPGEQPVKYIREEAKRK